MQKIMYMYISYHQIIVSVKSIQQAHTSTFVNKFLVKFSNVELIVFGAVLNLQDRGPVLNLHHRVAEGDISAPLSSILEMRLHILQFSEPLTYQLMVFNCNV